MKTKPATKRRPRWWLSDWKQHEILSHSPRLAPGRFSVRCVHRTVPLLRMAGISSPVPWREYEVATELVERAGKTLIVLRGVSR